MNPLMQFWHWFMEPSVFYWIMIPAIIVYNMFFGYATISLTLLFMVIGGYFGHGAIGLVIGFFVGATYDSFAMEAGKES